MTRVPPDPPPAPQPPPLDRDTVEALIRYARAQTEYSQWWVDFARTHDKRINPQDAANVEGWDFVAVALLESYDG